MERLTMNKDSNNQLNDGTQRRLKIKFFRIAEELASMSSSIAFARESFKIGDLKRMNQNLRYVFICTGKVVKLRKHTLSILKQIKNGKV